MSTDGHNYDNFYPHSESESLPPRPGGSIALFASITAVRPWITSSFEEVRLRAYQPGKVPPITCATSSTSASPAFGDLGFGIKNARLPFPHEVRHTPPAPPFEGLSLGTVKFEVGKDEVTTFTVHENLITSASDFASIRTIPLPDDTPEAFQMYSHWLYTRMIFTPGSESLASKDYPLLVQAYTLGDKLLDTSFQNIIIDTFISTLLNTHSFKVNITNAVYEHTPECSALRRLWCDVYAWCGDASWLQRSDLSEDVNAEFLSDLAKVHFAFWQGRRPERMPFLADRCAYHTHEIQNCDAKLR
ncbi:hypothetical protein LTR86_003122 [Recurvomyces mirabilis]|nr:hypothetical protein LTR86_003122 [Recurvomyces mirabilis]